MKNFTRFVKQEEGATAIEYGLIASLVSIAIVVALTTLSGKLQTVFATISTSL